MTNPVSLEQPGMVPPPGRPEPKRDHWDRYVIPDPKTGQERSWTRATTWAEAVEETYQLTLWKQRMTALGLANRPTLTAAVLAVLNPFSPDGKKKLNQIVKKALDAAQADERAQMGTNLHSFCEAHDSGRPLPYLPPVYAADLAAYEKAMRAVRISRNYIEKIGLIHSLGVAGTMDRLVAFGHRELPMVGDIKTGADLGFSWQKIAIQLALYAHSDSVFDPLEGAHRPMLQVDQKQTLVVHLPAGEARCQLYLIDIEEGWKAAHLCGLVRDYRNRKNLAQLLVEAK